VIFGLVHIVNLIAVFTKGDKAAAMLGMQVVSRCWPGFTMQRSCSMGDRSGRWRSFTLP
jgi:hypothetical protein